MLMGAAIIHSLHLDTLNVNQLLWQRYMDTKGKCLFQKNLNFHELLKVDIY